VAIVVTIADVVMLVDELWLVIGVDGGVLRGTGGVVETGDGVEPGMQVT
jgi:hypothetical protein